MPAELKAQALRQREQVASCVASADLKAADVYMAGGALGFDVLAALVRAACLAGACFPMLCGSALKNKAIQPLLDAITNFLPSPDDVQPPEALLAYASASVELPLAMLAFKVVNDAYVGSLCYVRLYSGVLSRGAVVVNFRTGRRERAAKILRMHANFRSELDAADAGDIVAVAGFKLAVTGDTLCSEASPVALYSIAFPKPVVQVALEPKTKLDSDKLLAALDKLSAEDPTLTSAADLESGQIIMSGMGELHLEVAIDRIRREHAVDVVASRPQVAYRETIAAACTQEYTHRKQTGGAGQFAKVKIVFEPHG